MSCIIEIKDSELYKLLKKRYGTNETEIFTIWNHVVNGDVFTEEFQKWQQAKRKTDTVVTMDNMNPRTIVNDVIEFYNRTKPDGNVTVLNKKDSVDSAYTSVADRIFCQRIVGNEILDIFRDEVYGKGNAKGLTKQQYIDAAIESFANRLRERLGLTDDAFEEKVDYDRFESLFNGYLNLGESQEVAEQLASIAETINIARKLLGKNITNQDANLIATLEEMINSVKNDKGVKIRDAFFDTIFSTERVNKLIKEGKDEFNTLEEDNAQDNEDVEFGDSTNEDDSSSQDTYDLSFRVFDNHSGQYSTFTTHIGGNIASYLNSLRKLNGTGQTDGHYSYNTDNAIGIADTMSANECAVILYTQADYSNVTNMIASIRKIADTVPGFEAFIQLADDLNNNFDFAYEFYRTFGKMVIAKKETYIDTDGERKVRISNTSANKIDSLRFEYLNSLRSSATNILLEYSMPEATKLSSKIEEVSTNLFRKKKVVNKKVVEYTKDSDLYKIDKTDIIAEFTTQLKNYLPTIDKSVIINYINNTTKNGVVDEVYNMKTLQKLLVNLINGAHSVKLNYTSKQAQAAAIARANRPYIEAMANGEYVDPSTLKNPNDVWAEDMLTTEAQQAAIQLANAFAPYALPKIELNSRNAEGNLSSDVINSSMISNLQNILNSPLNTPDNPNSPLNNYAAYKFRSKQYMLSNILVEKVENGIIVNKGLFKLVDGKYVPTSYATSLLKMTLFNGISDLGNSKAANYAKMSKGDYITTAMINYFETEAVVDDIPVASYMMRIPSDAPKNFMLTAPKYSLSYKNGRNTINFWEIENEGAVNNRIRELINNLPSREPDDYDEISLNSQQVSIEQAVKLITGNYKGSLSLNKTHSAVEIPNKASSDAYVTLEADGVSFIVKGTINKDKTELTNVKLHGLVGNYGSSVAFNTDLHNALTKHYKTQLIKGNLRMADGSIVKRRVNHNHPIYQQMYFAFKQEMQNAATALIKIFDAKTGQILFVDGEAQFGNEFVQLADPNRATYANYHRKENKYIDKNAVEHKESGIIQNVWLPVKDENGKIKYREKTNKKRLSGNVFNSDRFTIFDETTNSERNFLSEVISEDDGKVDDGKIHIFYGGAGRLHINSIGEVEFTQAQQALIDSKLEEFIEAYVNQAIERTSKFENLLEGTPHSEEDITEFILNYHLAYINCNDLFEGDTKFYKSAQDFLKRSKETQGSGVPYGIVDLTRPMFGEIHQPVKESYLNSEEMQAIVGKLNNCKQFTTFRGATVTNVIRTTKESQEILVEQLTKNFIADGIKEDVARKKAESMMKGYKNTKVNDAQSYITFEEWIRRISARGQLHKYKPLIEAILDESKPLDVSDINEFIQVQKNFYYDMYYDELTGVMAPRQIKNAEFVLVPRLIRGTELEQVYNAMVYYGIDQLNTEETSKAGKTNVLTLWDKEGNITKEWQKDFNSNIKSAIETFSYNYLYTQQETPQHMNAENKAGIQIMKKIIDNIDNTDENSPLYKVKQRFLRNYSENIYESFTNLMNELNVKFDENGNIITDSKGNIAGIDYNVFLSKLKDEMIRLGLDSNMMDFVTLTTNPKDGVVGLHTRMSSVLNVNRKKLESVSQAVFNNAITRQKLPGFHAAQITQIGFKRLNKTVKERIYHKELRYHPNGERYIEIMLPASNFGLSRNAPMWNDLRKKYEQDGLSVEEIEEKIDQHMLSYLQNKGLDTLIGYRIPTEGKQSVCVMKVVGFTPDAYGSTIVVPDDWVAQTGSDFDIDSIYGIQYSTRQNSDGSIEKIKYSTNSKENYISYVLRSLDKESKQELIVAKKSDKFALAEQLAKENNLESFEIYSEKDYASQNTREARNNQILDDMITILQSDEALEENLSQSQFKDVIDARDKVISDIDAARRSARSPYNFFDQADYQEDAMSGAKLKAFSVTLDTFCSVCNTVKPIFSESIDIVYTGDKTRFEELRERFDTKTKDGEWAKNVIQLDDNHILVKHTGLGYSNDNKNVVGKILTAYSSQTTAHILDAIKEGAIQNVNDLTFGVYKLFPNIGSDYMTAVSFMMQPGITRVVEAYNKNKSIYAKGYENPVNAAIRAIAKELGIDTKKASIQFIETKLDDLVKSNGFSKVNVLNSERLTDRIKEQSKLFSSPVGKLLFDYLVVKKYRDLYNIAGKIGKLTRVTNPDKFGAKQTIYETNKIFDDIKDILSDDKPVFSKRDGKSFLESIYPGISKVASEGIKAFVDNKDNNSSYPPLFNFLKYATATSILVNRNLFATQQPAFRTAIRQIINAMSGMNPSISEKTYNAFEQYVLCDLYTQIPIIANPVTYSYKKGIDYDKSGINFTKERERIFGYGYEPNLNVQDSEGNWVKFAPKDLLHPRSKEIEMFTKFTPAQKVYFIQKHFRDSLVCKYLKTNLVNNRAYRKNKSGAQTIEFIEDGVDKEIVYTEFYNTFANSNPLLVLTAMDIIKYAFIVEGYKMRRSAVNKVIDNDILINDKGLLGTGINASLTDIVSKFTDKPDMNRVRELVESFVRSHSTMSEISHTHLSKDNLKKFNRLNNGILTIYECEETNEFLTEHNIGYNVKNDDKTEFIANSYITITTGKNNVTLYKIKQSSYQGIIYLTPLNLLQESETSLWSANMENNKFPSPEFYSDLISEFESKHETWDAEAFRKLAVTGWSTDKDYSRPERKKVEPDSEPIDDWSIEDAGILKTQITNHFNGTTSQMLIIESPFLQDKIKGFGIEYGLRKIVNGIPYYIYRLDTRHYSDIAGSEGLNLKDYTSKKGLSRPIDDKYKPFEQIIQAARQRGIDSGHPGEAHIYYAYAVIPAIGSSEVRNSTITENYPKIDKAIRRQISVDDNLDAERYERQMSHRSIESNRKSITTNIENVVISSAEYVASSVDRILNGENGLNMFTQDPVTGTYLKITDSKVLDLIRESPALRRKYLKTILQARHLIDTFKTLDVVKYDTNEENLKYYVDKINSEIKKLSESSILKEAEELYVTGYLAKITNNPNITNNIISLMDGYHTTGFFTSWLNDLQDTTNPIIQIITSDVMADIRAKEFQGERMARDFRKFMRDIKAKAAKNGRSINWNNLVDEYGKWIEDYNDKYITDYEAIKEVKDTAYTNYKNAETDYDKAIEFEKYLKAKLDYDKWLLANTYQAIVDDYYAQMIALEESMINTDTGKFADIYVEWKMLNDRLRDVLSHDDTDPTFEKEKQEILTAIANLKSSSVYTPTGTYILKRDLEEYELSKDPIIRRNQNINSLSNAVRLKEFISKRNELNDKYYSSKERYGFQEQLNKYLELTKKYENRGLTEDDLYAIPEYVTAKTWLKKNAHFEYSLYKNTGEILTSEQAERILEEYFDGKLDESKEEFPKYVQAALNYLRKTAGERNNKNAIYKRIAAKNDARDEYGIIDARKFTAEEIATIKAEQEARFGIGESVPYSERSIMHNSTSDDTIYTSDFYKGMNVGGVKNEEYLKIVKAINEILKECHNPSTGVLETSLLSIEQINAVLDQFAKLGYDRTEQTFDTSQGIKKHTGVKRKQVKEVIDFIEKNVEFVLTEEDQRRFEAEKRKADKEYKGGAYYLAWCELNQEWDEAKQQFVPNHLLWGHAQPKSTLPKAERDKFISKKKTAAVRILRNVFTEKPTRYYEMERSRMINTYGAESAEFKAWEAANHIYNPHSHKLEPLVCWTHNEPNDNMAGKWEPTYEATEREVAEEFVNPNYKKDLYIQGNYKKTNETYSKHNSLNEEEKELKEYIQNLLRNLVKNKKAQKYIDKGYLPSKAVKQDEKTSNMWLKELAKGFGYVETDSNIYNWNDDSDVSFGTDYIPDMPMLQQLMNKDSHRPPYREAYSTKEEYDKAKKEYEENKEKYDKENRDIHKALLDNNWEDVIEEFITKAAHYNAVQDNKYQLYFGQRLLNDIESYQTRLSNPNHLVKDTTLSTDEDNVYKKSADTNLQKQYANWVRRIIFNEFKKNQGKKTRLATILQGITSTNYMTLNLRGGIANVLVGESNIWGEVFASEYLGKGNWLAGKRIWLGAMHSFAANAYNETSTTLPGAIVKGFNIIDYDEITGRVTQVGLQEWSKRVRDAAYIFNTGGEHFMQNSVMFSMMLSHRVVANPKFGQPGEPKYTFMNKEEYIAHNRELAIPEEALDAYREFIKPIKEDADKAKDYAWFRNDPITQFVMTRLSSSQQKQFIAKEKELRKNAAKTFEENPTVYSQFKLGEDGKLDFADNSILSTMTELKEHQEVSDAYKFMGRFKGRVISTNKKIHGNYGKLDAAMLESQWLGGLLMQYHKHIYPGILKRWRRQGYWNEERGTVEKGSYVALYDFLRAPIKQIAERNKLTSAQTEAITGIQKTFAVITDYLHFAVLNWQVMPQYEKANMARILGDIGGMLVALAGACLLRLGWDDDDDDFVYNLGLYEMDRLASETFMWNPIGLYSEGKKLWSSPVAAQSIVGDTFNIMGTISGILLDGDDYDPYFHGGRYSGEHKLKVYTERRIPYWRNWVALRDIADNNHYYKMGDNIISWLDVDKINK